MVITGVAEQVPEKIAHLVYLDAHLPQDGQSMADIQGPAIVSQVEEAAKAYGDGWKVPFSSNDDFRYTPHPLKSVHTRIEVKNPAAAALPHSYIYCTKEKEENEFLRFTVENAEKAKSDSHWNYREIKSTHGFNNGTAPQELVDILLDLA